jgi:hypothetical protein
MIKQHVKPTQFLLRLFLVAAIIFLSGASMFSRIWAAALPFGTFAYDAQNQTTVAYDGSRKSPVSYDSVSVLVEGEEKSETARSGVLLAKFAGFLAAEGLPVPEGLPTNINSPRQALHTPGPTLGPGRSPVTADAQALLDGVHAGEYPIIRLNPRGQPVVDFGEEIGTHVGPQGSQPTQFGTIHSGQNGAHIVPANPIQY